VRDDIFSRKATVIRLFLKPRLRDAGPERHKADALLSDLWLLMSMTSGVEKAVCNANITTVFSASLLAGRAWYPHRACVHREFGLKRVCVVSLAQPMR